MGKMNEALRNAFVDALEHEDDKTIQQRTGLPTKRCEEIYDLLLLARLDAIPELSRDEELIQTAIEGLKFFYPELSNTETVTKIKAGLKVLNTGNDQLDYENVRDQVERLVTMLYGRR